MDISAYQHMNIRMSTRGKRPLRNLTPSDKVRAIQRIHNGETKASVSRDIGVPESTLRGWCKNEQKLRFMCRQLGSADLLSSIPRIENPPEKRPRFQNLIHSPKYPEISAFDGLGYNRLSVNRLSLSPIGSNAILEKIALKDIMKKRIMSPDSATKHPVDTISTQMSSMMGSSISINGGYNSQISIMQNLKLLALINPNISAMSNFNAIGSDSLDAINNKISLRVTDESKDITQNNCNENNSSNNTYETSLSVKNWAKDPAGKNFLNQNINTSTTIASSSNNIGINCVHDSMKNIVKSNTLFTIEEAQSDNLSVPLTAPAGLLQSPNIDNTALLEWCKVFSASLNFLALAAAAATFQHNSFMATGNIAKKENNILYKELTATANMVDAANNRSSFNSSDVSNDSYFDSEPEDLSVRSTTTSKRSSPANSCCESPVKSKGSCSPLQCDFE